MSPGKERSYLRSIALDKARKTFVLGEQFDTVVATVSPLYIFPAS